jgi:prepilin-type N-terminal cleavage/methylation domain-containing protein
MNTKNRGFTLFELLISISIIGILTALAVVSYSGSQVRARNVRRIEDMNAIQKAAEQYYVSHNYVYPPHSGDFYGGTDPVLVSWPSDPKTGIPYGIYHNGLPATPNIFCACALMEGTNQGNSTLNCADFNNVLKPYYCVKGQQ